MFTSERTFYRQWILANGWSEAAGLGTTFVLGRIAADRMGTEMTGAAMILGGAFLAILSGVLLEGILVGFAQEQVLLQRLTDLRPRSWIRATAIGAGAAWLIGMLPSTIFALTFEASPGPAPDPVEPGPMFQYSLAVALGLITGPILGVVQWTVLRRLVRNPSRWLWANAVAWAGGMLVIFTGMDLIPWMAHPMIVILAIYAVCGAAGLVVGAIHGRVLLQLLPGNSAISNPGTDPSRI